MLSFLDSCLFITTVEFVLQQGVIQCTHYLLCFSFALQVLDWIENHGEAFLSKHTGVGKSLHRARALQKRHEDFEEVAQVKSNHMQDCAFVMEIYENFLLENEGLGIESSTNNNQKKK